MAPESSKDVITDSPVSTTSVEIAASDSSLILHSQSSALVLAVRPRETIPPLPTLFPDEVTTSQDWRYLQKLLQDDLADHLGDGSSSVIVVRHVTWNYNDTPHPTSTAFPWPTFPLSSSTFRYAALTFASYSGANDSCTLKYLGKFYEHAQKAIASSSLIEVMTASYPVLLYAFRSGAPFRQVLIHFKGICEGLTSRQFEALSLQNRQQLQNLWLLSLPALRRAFWTTQTAATHPSAEDLELLGDVCGSLQATSFLLYRDITQTNSRGRLEALEAYLAFYWEYHLAIRSRMPTSGLESCIRDVVQLIHAFSFQNPASAFLITQASRAISVQNNFDDYPDVVLLPEVIFEDIEAAYLYFWSKMLENALDSSVFNSSSIHASIALLRLAKSVSETRGWIWARHHPLFWTGIGLTSKTCPSGMTPFNSELTFLARKFLITSLQHSFDSIVSRHPSRERYYRHKFDTLFNFLEQTDSSHPSQDLYTMNGGGSTIYKCNRMTGRLYLS